MTAAVVDQTTIDLRPLEGEITAALPEMADALRFESGSNERWQYASLAVRHATLPIHAEIALSHRDGNALLPQPRYRVWLQGRRQEIIGAAAVVAAVVGWLPGAVARELRAAEGVRLAGALLTAEGLAPLRALAGARRAAATDPDALVETAEPLNDAGQDDPAFTAGVRRLVAGNFPRDKKGDLALGVTVLLAPRDPDAVAADPRARSLWYAAAGPERRRDPQTVRLGWHWCISENHTHRWDAVPWLWDPDAAAKATEGDRLGAEGLPWDRLGLENRDSNLAALEAAEDTHAARIGRTLLLQDAGRLREALELWSVRVAGRAADLLDGAGEPDECVAVREAARAAAPWRLGAVVAAERRRLDEWRAAKKGRPKKPANMALFVMPGPTVASRPRLFLCEPEPGASEGIVAELRLLHTAHEARLPRALWERPAEIDLRRFGLLPDGKSA